MFAPPNNETKNNNPADVGHFWRTQIDWIDFKNEMKLWLQKQIRKPSKGKNIPWELNLMSTNLLLLNL